ncbi:MAG: hypothetical protein CSYNP_01255 [Syntrophus sp. SKADARSKE-3]|nr:hypothetical protein [Syntrophus sp. SKADARSKE-3]
MDDEKKDPGFIIKDKRFFDETGVPREEIEKPAHESPIGDSEAGKPASSMREQSEPEDESFLPEVNFANFILSLSTTVMYHLGDFPDPVTNKSVKNFQAAKHTIDMIGMLKSKTEGNLDNYEKNLMDGILFELRMRYVKESGNK